MRFSTAFLAALSLLVSQVAATHAVEIRQDAKQKGGNKGNNGGGKGGNKGGNNGGKNGGGNNGNGGGKGGDIQSSKTLDPSVIATGFANNGQDVPTAGQVASLTSTNNFINFCATVPDLPITNGKQIKTGSCNPAPMGNIPSTDNMPSSKFVFPKNLDNIEENKSFTIKMAIQGMETGFFVNANENYFSAPQQLNGDGQITGHSHVVVEALDAIDSTQPSDPKVFAFFKGLNDKANNGVLTAVVDKGLPAGTYKLSSINTAANHQPCLVPIAQHGSLDDAIYFTVGADAQDAAGKVAGGTGAAGNNKKGNAKAGAAGKDDGAANNNDGAKGAVNVKGNTGAKADPNADENADGNADANADPNADAGSKDEGQDDTDDKANADDNANGKAAGNGKANGKGGADDNAKDGASDEGADGGQDDNAGAKGNNTGKGKGGGKGGDKRQARRFARVHRRMTHESS